MPARLHFASEPREIGGYLWRVIVTDSRHGGRRFLYQFAPIGQLPIWSDMQDWPGFSATARDMGLPVSLADLYGANAVAIRDALEPVAKLLMA